MNALEQRLTNLFTDNQLRMTAPRMAVFRVLANAEDALPLADIASAIKGDRATIYRTLDLFISLGVVQRVVTGFKHRYELAAPFHSHHHHIHCEVCDKVISFDSRSLEALIQRIAEQKGVHLHTHTLELAGCCDDCQNRGNIDKIKH